MSIVTNGRITDTWFGIEDHGYFPYLNLQFDYGGSSQGTALCINNEIIGTFIHRLLTTLKVDRYEQLKGIVCRVERTEMFGGNITGVGHALCRDEDLFRWADLDPKT